MFISDIITDIKMKIYNTFPSLYWYWKKTGDVRIVTNTASDKNPLLIRTKLNITEPSELESSFDWCP